MESLRLNLRRFEFSDRANMFELESDPDIMKFTPTRIPLSEEKSAQKLKELIEDIRAQGAFGVWAIEFKDSKDFAGWICLMKSEEKSPELGFMILKRHWGKGIATEAATRLIEYGFQELKVKGIVAKTDQHNSASQKVLRKLGFKSAGTATVADKVLQRDVVLDLFELLRY